MNFGIVGFVDLLKDVSFDGDFIVFSLADGRMIAVPLGWFPRLLGASQVARNDYHLSPFGVHWEELDEDISTRGIIEGLPSVSWNAELKNELVQALEKMQLAGYSVEVENEK